MISIIICSRTQTINSTLFENIKDTIGYDHELIVIDNSLTKYSIFEAYNLGIEKSNGNILCFIHDDVFIHTADWGVILYELFSDDKIGLVGVAGSKVKTKTPSAWWDCPHEQKVVNLIQHFNDGRKVNWNYGFEGLNNVEVVAIDGVLMVMRKNKTIGFDTKMEGFHNYDLNISFEHKKNNDKIIVTNQILIEHFSLGNLDESWLKSSLRLHKKYTKYLPFSVGLNKKSEDLRLLEVKNTKKILRQIFNSKHNRFTVFLYIDFFMRSLAIMITGYLKKISR